MVSLRLCPKKKFTSTYSPVPDLPREIFEKLTPIYVDLNKENLLSKCCTDRHKTRINRSMQQFGTVYQKPDMSILNN